MNATTDIVQKPWNLCHVLRDDGITYEETSDVTEAIAREKQIKGWLRFKKIALVESKNPEWRDLSTDWFEK